MNKFITLIAITILCSACKKEVYTSSVSNGSKKFSVENLKFDYLSSRSKVKFKSDDRSFSSVVQTRIKKDSVIWLSVLPAMGLEAARVLITIDSISILNRLKKEHYAYSYNELVNKYEMPLDYHTIESMFTGNLERSFGNLKVKGKEAYYVIEEKRNPLVIQNKISKTSFKLERKQIKDKDNQRTLKIDFGRFQEIEKQLMPGLITLLLENDNDGTIKTRIDISIQKTNIDEKILKFPFTVSSKYERKY